MSHLTIFGSSRAREEKNICQTQISIDESIDKSIDESIDESNDFEKTVSYSSILNNYFGITNNKNNKNKEYV